jgi:phosphatidylglycerophosphate synthase
MKYHIFSSVDELRKIPNWITLSRLLCNPFLLYFAIRQEKVYYGIVLSYFFLSDVLDGFLARYLKQSSKFGAVFDSFVDDISGLPILFEAYLLFPELAKTYFIYVLSIFLLLLIGYFFRIFFAKSIGIHLWSSKVALTYAVSMYLWFLFVGFNLTLFIIFLVLGYLSNIEVILVAVFKKNVNENTKSLFG